GLVDCGRVLGYRAFTENHQFGPEPQDQKDSEDDRCRDHRSGRIDDGVVAQYRVGEKSRTGPSGSGTPQRGHGKNPQTRTQESEVTAESELDTADMSGCGAH